MDESSTALVNALRAHFGTARFQASAVLEQPGISAAVLALCGPLDTRELGRLLRKLADQGAPLARHRGAQSYWRVTPTPVVERKRGAQAAVSGASTSA